jgi:hypothetical protein
MGMASQADSWQNKTFALQTWGTTVTYTFTVFSSVLFSNSTSKPLTRVYTVRYTVLQMQVWNSTTQLGSTINLLTGPSTSFNHVANGKISPPMLRVPKNAADLEGFSTSTKLQVAASC